MNFRFMRARTDAVRAVETELRTAFEDAAENFQPARQLIFEVK